MNYKIAMIPLLLCGLLGSCNDNEELIKTNPDFVEAGYGALTLTLKYPEAPQTRAVGDTLIGLAYPEEKAIKSVAFFVKTDAETVNSEQMYGSFGSYFSDEPLLAANGLQADLVEVTPNTPGEYTAKILHRSDGWKEPQVIVIANYLENGLAAKLKAVTDWVTLESVVSATLSENPKTPLLMYATKTIDAWKRSGSGNGGGSASADFEMERLVSRIDIRNNAYNKADESKGFVLTSAQLIRPKTASYLLPNTGLVTQAVSAVPFAPSGTVKEGAIGLITTQELDSLYAYENDNQDPATATAVQINGTYRGGNISKIIEMKKADGVDAPGDPIALARNRRYVVNINATPDSTNITWDIVVKEWGEGDTIKVKPDYQKPKLEDFTTTGLTNATWNAATKTLDITKVTATGETLTFKTVSSTASDAELVYGFDTDGSSVAENNNLPIVEVGKPIITYGAVQVETPITINIPLQKTDEKVPLDIYVLLRNAVNPSVYDSITIKSRPIYNNVAGAEPVLMKDGKFWAPINVGATTSNNKAVTTVNSDITADCGQLFQWGRKYGFAATNNAKTCENDTTGIGTLGRPIQGDPIDMAKWDGQNGKNGKFIYSTSPLKYNWLQINGVDKANPEDKDMVADAWYQKLWNANEGVNNAAVVKTKTDPCPSGWRVPTSAEWEAIGAGKTVSGISWDGTNFRLTVPGKETGRSLLLPAAGYRYSGSGTPNGQGSSGRYWSSSVNNTNSTVCYAGFDGKSTFNKGYYDRAGGYSVRCIQE